ncbi:MAG: enterotoxin A family protein, partial [Candidatus Sulfotelmatobacter sp.]
TASSILTVGVSHLVPAVQDRCRPAPQPEIVSGSCVAAEETADASATVFRADDRGPEEIFSKGFEPKGDNMDLLQHASSNPNDSGYISTSSRLAFAQDWAAENGYDYIYKLRATGLDVNAELGADSPFPYENEIAVPQSIPGSDIEGVWGLGGWMDNPGFEP